MSAAGLVAICAVALVAAVLELLLVPLRAGAVLAPVSVLLAMIGNTALPSAARTFSAHPGASVTPLLVWFVVVIGLAMTTRPEGDVLVPGGSGVQWVFYVMLLLGGAAGVAAMVGRTPPRLRANRSVVGSGRPTNGPGR